MRAIGIRRGDPRRRRPRARWSAGGWRGTSPSGTRAGPEGSPRHLRFRRTRVHAASAVSMLRPAADAAPLAPPRPDASALRVRASAAFAPCLAPVVEGVQRATPGPRRCSTWACRIRPGRRRRDRRRLGDDAAARRRRGGRSRTAVDLGYVPWVLSSAARPRRALRVGLRRGRGPGRPRRARGAHAARPTGLTQPHVTTDADDLGRAAYALVPRSLAGPGEHRPADVDPLMATAAEIARSRDAAAARGFLAFLGDARPSRSWIAACAGARPRPRRRRRRRGRLRTRRRRLVAARVLARPQRLQRPAGGRSARPTPSTSAGGTTTAA